MYDYIWLMDEDLELDLFNWDVYREVLLAWHPLFSQPAVVPKAPGGRSTDWPELDMARWRNTNQNEFHIAEEAIPGPEVMTPIISASMWPLLFYRFRGNDQSSVWHLDEYFYTVSMLLNAVCATTASVVVQGSPLTHLDFRTLRTRSEDSFSVCSKNSSTSQLNARGISRDELILMQQGLHDTCDIPDVMPDGFEDCAKHNRCEVRRGTFSVKRLIAGPDGVATVPCLAVFGDDELEC